LWTLEGAWNQNFRSHSCKTVGVTVFKTVGATVLCGINLHAKSQKPTSHSFRDLISEISALTRRDGQTDIRTGFHDHSVHTDREDQRSYGQTDTAFIRTEQTDGRTDRRTWRTDGQTDRQTDRQTDMADGRTDGHGSIDRRTWLDR